MTSDKNEEEWKPPTMVPLKMKGADQEEGEPVPVSMTTEADLENWFTFHPPREGQTGRYELLRAQGYVLAKIIYELTPPGPDQSAAIRKLREAVMTAIAGIACENESQAAVYCARKAGK